MIGLAVLILVLWFLATAEGRVRLSDRKDETHSPGPTRPGDQS